MFQILKSCFYVSFNWCLCILVSVPCHNSTSLNICLAYPFPFFLLFEIVVISPHYLIFPFFGFQCVFLTYEKLFVLQTKEMLGQEHSFRMMQETELKMDSEADKKNNLRMGVKTGCWAHVMSCVLLFQLCPLYVCVCVCPFTNIFFFFLGFSWHLFWIEEGQRIWESNYFSSQNSKSGWRGPDFPLGQCILEKMIANMKKPVEW